MGLAAIAGGERCLPLCPHPDYGWLLERPSVIVAESNTVAYAHPLGGSTGMQQEDLATVNSQVFLTHAWVDANLVTDKAVKQDEARVPTHLWDKQCSLVLPYSSWPLI